MTKQQFLKYCKGTYGTGADNPFGRYDSTAVLRHADTRKWYALVMRIARRKVGIDSDERVDVVNLKLPIEMCGIFGERDGVYPAYHMSKVHWVSVVLPDAPDDVVEILTSASYEATRGGRKHRQAD